MTKTHGLETYLQIAPASHIGSSQIVSSWQLALCQICILQGALTILLFICNLLRFSYIFHAHKQALEGNRPKKKN